MQVFVQIDQLHVVLDVFEDILQVSELYTFSNLSSQVFVGEAGEPELGTVRIDVPEEAINIDFQRGFGSFDSFMPAMDLVSQGSGFLDVQPLRPGRGTLNLLAQYALPYEDGMALKHRLPYATNSPTVVLRDVGVILDDNWQSSGTQTQQGEDFLLFRGENFEAGGSLELTFSGNAEARTPASPPENDTVNLAIGGVALLAVVIGGGLALRSWQTTQPVTSDTISSQDLLLVIKELDQAYEAGEVDETTYRQERQDLKEQLLDIWE